MKEHSGNLTIMEPIKSIKRIFEKPSDLNNLHLHISKRHPIINCDDCCAPDEETHGTILFKEEKWYKIIPYKNKEEPYILSKTYLGIRCDTCGNTAWSDPVTGYTRVDETFKVDPTEYPKIKILEA